MFDIDQLRIRIKKLVTLILLLHNFCVLLFKELLRKKIFLQSIIHFLFKKVLFYFATKILELVWVYPDVPIPHQKNNLFSVNTVWNLCFDF